MRYSLPMLLLLAACSALTPAAAPVPDQLPGPLDDTCDAASYASLLGEDATALERVLLLGQVRVIRPASVQTQDYLIERINFHVGDDGSIIRISCG